MNRFFTRASVMGNDADSPMWREEDQKMAPGLQETVNNMFHGQPDPHSDRMSSRSGNSGGSAGWDRVQAEEDDEEENGRRGR